MIILPDYSTYSFPPFRSPIFPRLVRALVIAFVRFEFKKCGHRLQNVLTEVWVNSCHGSCHLMDPTITIAIYLFYCLFYNLFRLFGLTFFRVLVRALLIAFRSFEVFHSNYFCTGCLVGKTLLFIDA